MIRNSSNTLNSTGLSFKGLLFKDYRLYLFVVVLIALDVWLPLILHQFNIAGAVFLPMQFFVLLGGLALGWRAGLLVGLLTPLLSHAISGMPLLALLPQITIENSAYGFTAGLLRERFNLGIYKSLLFSMLGGRLALLWAVTFIYWNNVIPIPMVASWLQPVSNTSLAYLWAVIIQGLPGIILQLIFLPLLAGVADRWLQKR
jgi:hypothetical protein